MPSVPLGREPLRIDLAAIALERGDLRHVVGIELADGKVLGDTGNVKFRFTDAYMADAAAGKL